MPDTLTDLHRRICIEPHNVAARLVYADALEEQGDAASLARAEFIRLQIKMAACRMCHRKDGTERRDSYAANCGRCKPGRRREQELLRQHGEQWVKDLLGDTYRPFLHGGGRVEFANGFPDHILLPLAAWLGKRCGYCEQIGRREMVVRGNWECAACSGRGYVGGHGAAIVAAVPVARVEATDMPIFQSGGNSTYYVGGLGQLPQEFWRQLDGLPSRPAAMNALSAVLIRLARRWAGMPEEF